MYRVVFAGTSEFAVPSLNALWRDPHFEISGVITQPDRPVGRHATLTPPPVKLFAEKMGFPLFQPEKLTELRPTENSVAPDVLVVVSYGKIIPQWMLDIPIHGCVNVHGSLLPRWRGASPIQAAIAAGDKETGITIMKMDAALDHGPIITTATEPIRPDDTGGSLHDRLAELGAAMLPTALLGYLDGTITPVEQDHARATTCRTLTRDDGKIDWTKSADEIELLVRAYNPWPGTWTEIDGKRIKIFSASITSPSKINPTVITCGDGKALQLTSVQPEGGKRMSGEEFLRGLKTLNA